MRVPASPFRAIAVLAAAIVVASGCQVFSPARPTGRAILRVAPAGATTGLVRLDMARLRAAWSTRALKSLVPESLGEVAKVRLSVAGPGITTALSASMPFTAGWSPDPVDPSAGMTLSLVVPAGLNRVFTLEGLNADDQPVRRLMAAASVTGGEPIALEMSYLTDAAAQVLHDLVSRPALTASEEAAFDALSGDPLQSALAGTTAPDKAGIVASLASADLIAALTSHVNQVVGYNAATNTFSGADPGRFRARLLANLLRLSGKAALATTPDPRLAPPAAGLVSVVVQDSSGNAIPGAAAAVYDPYRPYGAPKGTSSYDFMDVPPGTWTVVATYGGQQVYRTVTVVDGAPTGPVTITLSGGTPSPTPMPVITAFPLNIYVRDVAIDAGGNAWVPSGDADEVVLLSTTGSLLGSVPVGDNPAALAIDAGGNVWVANGGSDNVTNFDSAGSVVGTYSVGGTPAAVAIDAGGNVWVANSGTANVTKLSSAGDYLGNFAVGSGPAGVAIDVDGSAWVTNKLANTVTKLSSSGSPLGSFTVGGSPEGVAVDVLGNVWVANLATDNLTKLDKNGNVLGTIAVGDGPRDVAIDGNGVVWVTNYNAGTVTRLSLAGSVIGTDAVGAGAQGIAVDANGHGWVANPAARNVSKIVP